MLQQNVDKNIISKIEKLLALGSSPNENEASLAMMNAQKLLAKYNLDIMDIKKEEDVQKNVIESGKKSFKWKTILIQGIARSNYCDYIIQKGNGSYSYLIIGRKVNIIAVRNMYDYLLQAIEKWAKTEGGKGLRNKTSYKEGMSYGLSIRLWEMKCMMEKQGVSVEETTCTALALTSLSLQTKKENSAFINKEFTNLKSSKYKGPSSLGAFQKGERDSSNIQLNEQLS